VWWGGILEPLTTSKQGGTIPTQVDMGHSGYNPIKYTSNLHDSLKGGLGALVSDNSSLRRAGRNVVYKGFPFLVAGAITLTAACSNASSVKEHTTPIPNTPRPVATSTYKTPTAIPTKTPESTVNVNPK